MEAVASVRTPMNRPWNLGAYLTMPSSTNPGALHPGINGTLPATQNDLEALVLQLTNLHGDIIAIAYLSETVTGLASSADTSDAILRS